MSTDLKKYQVLQSENIRNGVKKMDAAGIGFMTVVDSEDRVVGVFTDGDFRKSILKGVSLDDGVTGITNDQYKFLEPEYDEADVDQIFKTTVVEHLPVLDAGMLVEIVEKATWYAEKESHTNVERSDTAVVIMAGGKGTRMAPFTHILPKALVPINEKPIIEIIMDEFLAFGMGDFHISVNDKAKMIKAYFEDRKKSYQIEYIDETEPLGTAGSLKDLEGKMSAPFFVSNCDIIIRCNYPKILKYHNEGGYALTVVASLQHHSVPYGVCEIGEGGSLKAMKEKPEYDFLVNTGMYIMNPEVLGHIPKGQVFNMTDMIDTLQKEGISVGVYPVSENTYIDIGQWSEYKKAINILST